MYRHLDFFQISFEPTIDFAQALYDGTDPDIEHLPEEAIALFERLASRGCIEAARRLAEIKKTDISNNASPKI